MERVARSIVGSLLVTPCLAMVLLADVEQVESTVVVIEGAEPTSIAYGDHTSGGGIGVPIDIDRFTFAGAAAEIVEVAVTSTSVAWDPCVEIRDSQNGLVGSTSCSGGTFNGCALLLPVTLPRSDQYTIRISDCGQDEVGTYILQLERRPPTWEPPFLAYDFPASGSIEIPTDRDYFQFHGQAGSAIQVSFVSTTVAWDPVVTLFDPLGVEVGQASCFGGTFNGCSNNLPVTLTETGTHLFVIQDNGTDEGGSYILNVNCFAGCPPFAQVIPRNGSGVNTACYTNVFTPALGGTWCADVDATTNPGATVSLVAVCAQGLAAPRPTAFGELLVNLSTEFLCSIEILAPGQTVARHSANVPANPALLGVHFYTQALTYAPGPPFGIELCNAIEYVAGY